MSGTLQAHARHEPDGTVSVYPLACPLADKAVPVGPLYCLTFDQWGQENRCPYLLGLTHAGAVTRPITVEEITRNMYARSTSLTRIVVRCSEARPTAMPGA